MNFQEFSRTSLGNGVSGHAAQPVPLA